MEVNLPIQNCLLRKEWRDRKGVQRSNKWPADISRNHNFRKRRVSCTLTTSITIKALHLMLSPRMATIRLPSQLLSTTIRTARHLRRCIRTGCRLLIRTIMASRCHLTTRECTRCTTAHHRKCSTHQEGTCLLVLLLALAILPTILPTRTCNRIPTTIREGQGSVCRGCRECLLRIIH